ncbi:U3 small nucleolar RNA-associated protein 10 [Rhynchospora pubera]|uniref:U3 small nucleolar RNA-associated protein 10 n=1 Tax=Rhynchospora pubera TaxID=906938 RepID=A0AAV8CTW1_9POAL|nr:U3 small nucleolar RNA-associated protein 10 [Rhynchospora pubera]
MISAQLQAIKALTNAAPPPPPGPQTRPSILYDPKEAADIDLRTLLPIALAGLEVLIESDKRFSSYRETLFSQTSLELNRQMMNKKENEKLNKSIHSYLRLLSGHLLHLAARKTLEYLIRRYMVHVYNIEELILCAFPYHDTHVFVQLVQLIELGNTKWGFLEGVKSSGAAPPRHILVQQCTRDKGLLETLCNYASADKNFQHPAPVISFCTAVIVETLGSMPTLDTDAVQRVLGFVFSALNLETKAEREHKAGALMIIGLLATRARLAVKMIQKLVLYVATVARQDANDSLDLPWLRVTTMALISIVQSQDDQIFPKKTVLVMQEIRDFTGVLSELSKEYNIQRFMDIYLESLIAISTPDNLFFDSFVHVIEKIPLKRESIEKIISKVLAHCTKMERSTDKSNTPSIGKWLRKIRAAMEKHYPLELQASINKAFEKGESLSLGLHLLLDRTEDLPVETFNSKLWVSLEHPKVEIRKSAIRKIAESSIIKELANNPQELVNVQDAVIRGLSDENLSVVQAALSIEGMAEVFNVNSLLKTYQNVLSRCIDIITKGASNTSRASDVMVSCLERMVELQSHNPTHAKDVAWTIFPLLVVRSKTSKVNYKAVELFNAIKWPFFAEGTVSFDSINFEELKNFDAKAAYAINSKIIVTLSSTFLENPKEYIGWLVESAKASNLSKSLFLQITLHALSVNNKDFSWVMELYKTCFCSFKSQWSEIRSPSGFSLNEEEADKFCTELTASLSTGDIEELNSRALVCIFWRFLKACASAGQQKADNTNNIEQMVDELFLFLCTAQSKHIFQKHLQFLVINCTRGLPLRFLSKFFTEEGISTEVQVESLRLVTSLSESSSLDEYLYCQLLLGLPSFFIPLSHKDKDVRASAMNCIESILTVWRRFCTSLPRNGNNNRIPQCVLSDKFSVFLEALVDQKNMISSDPSYLSSYLPSLLGSSNHHLMVPDNVQDRFDNQTRDGLLLFFLNSALTYSSYGKLTLLQLLKGMGSAIYEVEGAKRFLQSLIERWNKYHFGSDVQNLTSCEIDILCLLLEVYLSASSMLDIDANVFDSIVRALRTKNFSPDDFAVVQPVITILQTLKSSLIDSMDMEMQDKFFTTLVLLLRNENTEVRNATRETLLCLNMSHLTIRRLIDAILFQGKETEGLEAANKQKKRKPSENLVGLLQESCRKGASRISFLVALLEMLLLKKDLVKRGYLVKPLLQILSNLFSDEVKGYFGEMEIENENVDEELSSNVLYQARQLTLVVLKDIMDLLEPNLLQDELLDKGDVNLLVNCARSATVTSIRNHIFALISSVARVFPQLISDSIIGIFSVIGGSALKQDDSHSTHVVEDLIAALVPCWLSITTSVKELLQIFVEALPDLAPHRRLMLILYLSRTLGEDCSLGTVIYLLLHAMVKRILLSTHGKLLSNLMTSLDSWEYTLALQLCAQYSCKVWFPSLVKLLKEVQLHEVDEQFLVQFLALKFIMDMLQDTELLFELESKQAAGYLQVTLGSLMEQVVLQLQNSSTRKKHLGIDVNFGKEFSDLGNKTLKNITRWMVPSTFFRSITQLIGHENRNVQRKALGLLCETLREEDPIQKKLKETRKSKHRRAMSLFQLDENGSYSFHELCSKLVQLITDTNSDYVNIKVASISSLEVLASKYPSNMYITSLPCIANHISSDNLGISSAASRASGAFIHVLGSKALPQLPLVMKHVVETAQKCMKSGSSGEIVSFLFSVFSTLEAIVDKLSGFLNPYLQSILDLVLLHPEFIQGDLKLNLKAAEVRKLLTEKIPVRLLLQPLLQVYTSAKECGETSLSLTFEMLSSLISLMDRPSVGTYHAKIFEHCLVALDARREAPDSVKNVNLVEQSVINALTGLTMRLTESMFRPLFLHSLEWAESEVESGPKSFDRAISFYKLVNKLAEQHRSLFVPYFKYLLEICVRYLSGDEGADVVVLKQKKKKSKISGIKTQEENELVPAQKHWYLRTLIVKALHKCFLYDADQKILDSPNFEVLLKPIVAQFALEPPLSSLSDVPTVEEMDESLVLCLGQMAVTAKSDVLWKPLNHEVLMQTRTENVRPKMLGLKVIKYLVEHLKEEYLVFLPESIPFLGELLEDADLSVKTLAQEILKEMETLSGESLRQYL